MWKTRVSLAVMAFVVFLVLSLLIPGAHADSHQQKGKVLVAVYAAGGSLETDYDLITDDIRQIVTGVGNTTPDTLEVLAAYGGSQKPGWQGMTITNCSGLADDLSDGKLGNRTDALASYPSASMGNAITLGTFLSFIRTRYQYDRVFLILIGHGEAYTGMLFDQNHEDDPLTIAELVRGLEIGGFNVEVIGLDTCLMSSLEVASHLSGYAKYMIASEESEPAEGWRYDVFISYLASHPDAPVADIGQLLLQTYLENPVQGKTLSVLNLDEAGIVTASLDRLSKVLLPLLDTPAGYEAMTRAFHATQQFGLTGEGVLDPATMDLIGFGTEVGRMESYYVDPADDLVNATRNMVVLSGHDDLVPGARGIAILSPVQINSGFYEYYRDDAAITPSWDRFMTRYLELGDNPVNKAAPSR